MNWAYPGAENPIPVGPPRRKPYPIPPLPINPQGELFAQTAKKLGLHPFSATICDSDCSLSGTSCLHPMPFLYWPHL